MLILPVFILIFLVSGCSFSKNSPPSRSKVEEMLLDKKEGERFYISGDFGRKNESDTGYSLCDIYSLQRKGDFAYLSDILLSWEKDGLVKKLSDTTEKDFLKGQKRCIAYEFTDAAKPFLTKKDYPVMAILKGFTVTGMTEPADLFGKKTITVEYKTVSELTPLGKAAFSDTESLFEQNGFSLSSTSDSYVKGSNGKATLVLYDDGWRIDKMEFKSGGSATKSNSDSSASFKSAASASATAATACCGENKPLNETGSGYICGDEGEKWPAQIKKITVDQNCSDSGDFQFTAVPQKDSENCQSGTCTQSGCKFNGC